VFDKVVSEQVYRYMDIPNEDGKYVSLPGAAPDESPDNKDRASARPKEQIKTRLTEKERGLIDGYTLVDHHMKPELGTVSRAMQCQMHW
jgi:hypothetical protein